VKKKADGAPGGAEKRTDCEPARRPVSSLLDG